METKTEAIINLIDQISSSVDSLFGISDGYLDGGVWYSFKNLLILSDNIDSLRTDPSFKEGLYIVCEIVMTHNVADYMLDNIEGSKRAHSAMYKLIEALDLAEEEEKKRYSLNDEDTFIIKSKLKIIAEMLLAVTPAMQLRKAA
ncbi:MAG TPA: hypothetical protein VD884_14360 [Ohtaekwangia sp.]|nr:hypothetical protein [Ohtaekwangia sp.]